MAHALPTTNAGQCAAVPASIAMLSDESIEDSFHVHSSAGCTTSSSLLEELVCPPCPITCKVASSANIPIRNKLNSNDLEYHKKYPIITDHSYVGVCVENHTPPTPFRFGCFSPTTYRGTLRIVHLTLSKLICHIIIMRT